MSKLNVLHVLAEIKPSGAEMMLLTALSKFRASGVTPSVLSTGTVKGVFADRFTQAGCEVLHMPFQKSPFYFISLWNLFREDRWDVIHLHTERANFYFGLAAVLARKRTLRTVHNVFPFRGFLRWRRGVQRRILEYLGLRHVAIGSSVLANERLLFRTHPSLVRNWYNDVAFSPPSAVERAAARRKLGVDSEKKIVIVSVGNCSEVKNHVSIIRAIASIPREERPIYFHAGMEEVDRPELDLSEKLGVDIHFLGAVSDIPELLQAADVFVMPSLYEGMSIASMEALACGLLTVLSDVPGLRDLKEDFSQIIYCNPSVESVRQAIMKAMTIPYALRIEAGVVQSLKAREMYGISQGVKGYSELYSGVS